MIFKQTNNDNKILISLIQYHGKGPYMRSPMYPQYFHLHFLIFIIYKLYVAMKS